MSVCVCGWVWVSSSLQRCRHTVQEMVICINDKFLRSLVDTVLQEKGA